MSGSYIADRVAAIFASHGEPMTLSRTADSATLAVTCKRLMKSRSGGSGEIDNTFGDNALYFKISNAELAAAGWSAPKIDDKIQASDGRWHNITHVDTRLEGGVVVGHNLFTDG